jgi:phosphinothricin acetyltransferase
MEIRQARPSDLPAIVAIYNAAIPGHTATADTAEVTVADREAWFAAHQPDTRPLWVGEVDGYVCGWVSLSTFYGRPAYNPTVEISVYVHPEHQRQGVGRTLVEHTLEAAPKLGVMTILAVIFAHNEASLRLFESLGFVRWGHLPRVAHMPAGRRDVVFLGLEL